MPQNMYVAMAGLSIICFTCLFLICYMLYLLMQVISLLDHIVSEVQLLVAAFAAFWILLAENQNILFTGYRLGL